MAANADGESVALGGFESDDGMEHACFSGGPHRFGLPSYAAAGCAANGSSCGIARGEVVPRQVHRRVRWDERGQLGRHRASELVRRNVEQAEPCPPEVRREGAVEAVAAEVNELQCLEFPDGELAGEAVASEPQHDEAGQPAQRGGEAARERVSREVELLETAHVGHRPRVRELAGDGVARE